jgi:hypothetical protein
MLTQVKFNLEKFIANGSFAPVAVGWPVATGLKPVQAA